MQRFLEARNRKPDLLQTDQNDDLSLLLIVIGRTDKGWQYSFSKSVMTKYHKLGGLDNIHLFSHSSGGYKVGLS